MHVQKLINMNHEITSPQRVRLDVLLNSKDFQDSSMKLPCVIGVVEDDSPCIFDLSKAPHVIISGKPNEGICNTVHAIMNSLLMKKCPEELKFVLIDARFVEFTAYKTLSSLYLARMPYLEDPIISDASDGVNALTSLNELMHIRYNILRDTNCRNVEDYNSKIRSGKLTTDQGPLPYYVVVINELGDFMMTVGKEFEHLLTSLAQLSRAVGIHVIVTTHRPMPEVLTGSIKANFPCRIAFKTLSERDSRIIIDNRGAEELSCEEMLFVCGGTPVKAFGVNVDEGRDIPILCGKLISQYPTSTQAVLPIVNNQVKEKVPIEIGKFVFQYADPLFKDAAKIIVENQSASTSLIQRSLGIGYNRASRMLEMLESAEIVSSTKNGTYYRDVLIEDTRELMYKLLDIKMELLKQAEKELF